MKVVATSDVTSPHYLESFEVDADHLEIKVRGNSTALEGGNNTEGKRAYRLKFAKKDKTTGIDYKHDLINGGYSKRNWVLLANVMDHSMLRNAITCELGKIVGMPFNPGYKFVDLVINGDYRGTYQVSDHPEVDSKRININEDTGWYVEFQGQKRMCDYPMFIETPYLMNVKNPEPTADEETEPELYETQRNDILNAVSAWFGPNGWQKGFGSAFTDPKTGWRAYNDEETLMKWWIVTEITGDYDGMMTVKAYREEDGKLHWGPVWDKDLAYGNYDNSNLGVPNGSLVMNCTNSTSYMKEIFSKFAADPSFIKKVKNEMDRLVNEGLKSNLCAKVDDLAIIIAPTEALNKTKWGYDSPQAGITEQYHGGVAGYDNYQAYVNQLKEWINGRVDYVQEQLTALSNAANTATEFEYDVKTVSSDAITAKMGKLVNATMKNRSFTANVWNTISLPFSVTESQLTSIFGTGYVLKEFSGVDGTNMLFTTPEGNTITGGVPYLIKPTQNVSGDIVFENVIVIANAKGWVNNFEYGAEPVCFGNYEFIGNLANTDNAWDRKKINNDLTLTDPNGDGSASQAFIRILNNAAEPTITFPEAVEPVVRTQLADVPTIYIDTQDGAAIQPSTGEYVPAAIEVLDKNNMIGGGFTETSSYLEVRGRGKTEWAVEDGKKSYRLKFAKDEKDADGNVTTSHKHDLTNGGYTKRNWILLANAADESLVRNALADELGKAMGFAFTPKYQHVDLYINNVYQGTYLATDHVEADAENGESKRVPVDEKQGWLLDMTNQDGIATGDVYVEGGESYPYINIKNPEPGNKTGTEEEIRAKVKKFFDELWAASDGTGIDKASFINWYIATEILGNANALTGIYAYKNDTDAELKFGPLWGNELALGNSAAIDMSDLTISASYTGMVYQSGTESAWKTKLQELWTKNWFKNAVKTRWAELYKSGVNDLKATMLTKYAALKTAVGQSHDGAKDDEITEIQNYLSQRFEYLDAKFAELTQTTALIGDVNGDGSVNVTDIMAIAQHILGKTPAGFDTVAADVDENGSINVNDIMKLVTIILEKE